MSKISFSSPNVKDSEVVDKGSLFLECFSCGQKLVIIWKTQKSENTNFKLKANCPFCGDESSIQEIKGMFHYSGYHIPKTEDEVIAITDVSHVDLVGDVWHFKVKKSE